MTPYIKTIARSIRQSFGRFLAILAIIALGVGFMCGLMQSNPSFILTGNTYIAERKMFDFRLLSTIGFDEEDIEKIVALDGIVDAEGAYSADVVARLSSQEETSRSQVRIHSLTSGVNTLKVEAGRLPENANEIVVDGYLFADPDEVIGTQLILSGAAGQDEGAAREGDDAGLVGCSGARADPVGRRRHAGLGAARLERCRSFRPRIRVRRPDGPQGFPAWTPAQ